SETVGGKSRSPEGCRCCRDHCPSRCWWRHTGSNQTKRPGSPRRTALARRRAVAAVAAFEAGNPGILSLGLIAASRGIEGLPSQAGALSDNCSLLDGAWGARWRRSSDGRSGARRRRLAPREEVAGDENGRVSENEIEDRRFLAGGRHRAHHGCDAPAVAP